MTFALSTMLSLSLSFALSCSRVGDLQRLTSTNPSPKKANIHNPLEPPVDPPLLLSSPWHRGDWDTNLSLPLLHSFE
uniref:Putative secreted protein n=1 Tax=Anopheles darlingi TaxID=43151 RepID=A0A2M4D352_ANODA